MTYVECSLCKPSSPDDIVMVQALYAEVKSKMEVMCANDVQEVLYVSRS